MFSAKRLTAVLTVLMVLLIITAGCSLIGPKPKVVVPDRKVPVTKKAAASLEKKLQSWTKVNANTYRLTVTESEVTSYFHFKLSAKNLPVDNATVWFEPDSIYLRGDIQLEDTSLHGTVVTKLIPFVADGHLQVKIEEAYLGSLPLPTQIRSPLADALNSALVSGTSGKVKVKEVQVRQEMLTLIVEK